MASDGAGNVHIAALGNVRSNRGVWYFTNVGGTWSHKLVAVPPADVPNYAGEGERWLSVAIDDNRSVWIAFTWFHGELCAGGSCQTGLDSFYVTNASGSWAEPVRIGDAWVSSARIALRDGVLHVAYQQEDSLWYADSSSGLSQLVARSTWPEILLLGDGGSVSIDYGRGREMNDGWLMRATRRDDGTFDSQRSVPWVGTPAVDPLTGDVVAQVWSGFSEEQDQTNVYLSDASGTSWSDPTAMFENTEFLDVAADAWGTVHLLASACSNGGWGEVKIPQQVIYLSRPAADGAFTGESLTLSGAYLADLVVDGTGRPLAVFNVFSYEDMSFDLAPGLWFMQEKP